MATESFDLIVLGAGNAGQAAAGAARAAGWSVAIVEEDLVGGVCPNRGCTPKKVLVAAAEVLDTIRRAGGHAIEVHGAKLDWPALIARKQSIVAPLPEAMAKSLAQRGIELVRGRGSFVEGGVLRVGERQLSAPKIVIATGSRPRPLSFPGAELVDTSDDFLAMEQLPASMVFIGAGVISMEFAHVLARAGSQAIVLGRGDRPLGNFDAEAVEALVVHSRAVGIDLRDHAKVLAVHRQDRGLLVEFEEAGARRSVTVERVLNGSGRVANVDGLGLEHLGIKVHGHKVAVDVHLRSVDNPDVYFAGDALDGAPQLSPVATTEGKLVGHNLLHEDQRAIDYRTNPSAVFTIPSIARVGLTAEAATAQGLAFEVKRTDMRAWISARTYREEAAYAKVLVEQGSGLILGADLVGHGAADTVHVFSLAMRYGIPASALQALEYAYPTATSDVKYLV
jgi:glutathione reductase (NADPH)